MGMPPAAMGGGDATAGGGGLCYGTLGLNRDVLLQKSKGIGWLTLFFLFNNRRHGIFQACMGTLWDDWSFL
jgi:hypothetical protein